MYRCVCCLMRDSKVGNRESHREHNSESLVFFPRSKNIYSINSFEISDSLHTCLNLKESWQLKPFLDCWYIRQMDPPPLHSTLDAFWVGFFPRSGPGVDGTQIKINTGYSCYLICNNSRHRMAVQSIYDINSYSLVSVILVFVCLCLFRSPYICHCICLFYLYY